MKETNIQKKKKIQFLEKAENLFTSHLHIGDMKQLQLSSLEGGN